MHNMTKNVFFSFQYPWLQLSHWEIILILMFSSQIKIPQCPDSSSFGKRGWKFAVLKSISGGIVKWKYSKKIHQKGWWFLSLIASLLHNWLIKIEQITFFEMFPRSNFFGKKICYRNILDPPFLQKWSSSHG